MAWVNFGDMDPKEGCFLVREEEMSFEKDFRAISVVEVVPEKNVGGDDSVFLLREGGLYLSADDLASALDVIGLRIEQDKLCRIRHDGAEEKIDLSSREALFEICQAAYAYGGLEVEGGGILVRIGLPSPYDADPKFSGEILTYPEKTSLFAIMRGVLTGFDHDPSGSGAVAREFDTLEGLWAAIPRSVSDRSDLIGMLDQIDSSQIGEIGAGGGDAIEGGFDGYEVDAAGNPCLWRNVYEHASCDVATENCDQAPRWTLDHTGPCADDCPDCGENIEPVETLWIGPSDPAFRHWFETLPESVILEPDDPTPDF